MSRRAASYVAGLAVAAAAIWLVVYLLEGAAKYLGVSEPAPRPAHRWWRDATVSWDARTGGDYTVIERAPFWRGRCMDFTEVARTVHSMWTDSGTPAPPLLSGEGLLGGTRVLTVHRVRGVAGAASARGSVMTKKLDRWLGLHVQWREAQARRDHCSNRTARD